MPSDDPPRRKRDWRAPDTGRGAEVGERPDWGRGPEVGQRPDTGEGPEWGRGPDVGRGPDTGEIPKIGPGPDLGHGPETGEGPDTSRIEEEDRLGAGGPRSGPMGGRVGGPGGGPLGPAAVLMLADARFPAGGHAHSGGLEGAVTAGAVRDVGSLEFFLRGRLGPAGGGGGGG